MRVYRLEARDGKGPYNTNSIDYGNPVVEDTMSRMRNNHSSDMTCHPSVSNDSALQNVMLVKEHLFGFSSMRQLYAWFGGWLKSLLEIGFSVKVYDVPDRYVTASSRQCVFSKQAATVIK